MGTKLTVPLRAGISNLSMIVLDGSAQWWNTNGSTFEAYTVGNIAQYAVAGTEHGSTGIYAFTFPSAISAGQYTVYVIEQAGASLAESDFSAAGGPATVDWDGSAFATVTAINERVKTLDDDWADGGRLDAILDTGASGSITTSTTIIESD